MFRNHQLGTPDALLAQPYVNMVKIFQKIYGLENFNYLNVAFISYMLTMWDLMLFLGCHTRGQRLRKKDRSC